MPLKRIVALALLCSIQYINAQSDSLVLNSVGVNLLPMGNADSLKMVDLKVYKPPFYKWKYKKIAGLDVSEVAFVNWNAGGSNSISALVSFRASANYEYKNVTWMNSGRFRYGINKQEEQRLRKTEDLIELVSNFGYQQDTTSNWYFSGRFSFNTQLTNGYKYPNRDNPISRLMAPGYIFIGGGAEYGRNLEKFSLYLSPLTFKATFVLDEDLSNAGSFGVTPATFDDDGNIIKEGERVRTEMGILVSNQLETTIMDNVGLRNALSLYTDYLNNFGNIDVDWELVLDFKVNEYVKATLGSHLRYDDDVEVLVEQEPENEGDDIELVEDGPRIQWKQLLGVGVVVGF